MQGSGQMSLSNRDSSYGYVSLEAPILSHTEGAHGHSTCQGTRKNRWITVQLVGAIGLWGDIFVSFYLATFVLVLQKKKKYDAWKKTFVIRNILLESASKLGVIHIPIAFSL